MALDPETNLQDSHQLFARRNVGTCVRLELLDQGTTSKYLTSDGTNLGITHENQLCSAGASTHPNTHFTILDTSHPLSRPPLERSQNFDESDEENENGENASRQDCHGDHGDDRDSDDSVSGSEGSSSDEESVKSEDSKSITSCNGDDTGSDHGCPGSRDNNQPDNSKHVELVVDEEHSVDLTDDDCNTNYETETRNEGATHDESEILEKEDIHEGKSDRESDIFPIELCDVRCKKQGCFSLNTFLSCFGIRGTKRMKCCRN